MSATPTKTPGKRATTPTRTPSAHVARDRAQNDQGEEGIQGKWKRLYSMVDTMMCGCSLVCCTSLSGNPHAALEYERRKLQSSLESSIEVQFDSPNY